MKQWIGIAALVLTAAAGGAAEFLADGCREPEQWRFSAGTEFPGACGGISGEGNGIAVRYDFTGGGAYVAVSPAAALPEASEYRITVLPDRELTLNFRLTDSNGRNFQGKPVPVPAGKEMTLAQALSGPWTSSWGGKAEVTALTPPVRELALTIAKPAGGPPAGKLLLQRFSVVSERKPDSRLAGRNFRRSAAGWRLSGEWLPQPEGMLLKCTAVPEEGARPAELALAMPRPGRDSVERFRLEPGQGELTLYWKPDFPFGVNPRNSYRVRLSVRDDGGWEGAFPVTLAGRDSAAVNLGRPMNSREIPRSRFGTCVHFSYAPKPEGPFRGWYPKERLLDEIAACGFKYIREGLALDRQPDGTWKLRSGDLETLKLAKARGIEQIAVIDMSADEPLPEFLERVRAVVEGSRDYVNVYELGNEPNNFGNWIGKFGGSWNANEKDGSVSKWLPEFIRYTDAAAGLIRRIAPDKTVIGLGAPTPANFRALALGVSGNLDGVTDHPYNYSLPPEKVPFGWNLEKRDGVRVGDRDNSFAGLVDSYVSEFRRTGRMRSLWVTEFGFTGFWFDGRNEQGLYVGYTPEAQAVYLLRRFVESLALPVAVTCQYAFLDDYYSVERDGEANFGLLRGDYSRKEAFYVMQRMNSLLHNAEPDRSAEVKLIAAPLHRGMVRGELVKGWDEQSISAANGVRLYAFRDPARPEERLLAVWSMLPYGREFNNRSVSFEIENWADFSAQPVAINLLNGDTYDIPFRVDRKKLVVSGLSLKEAPLLIKFFR